MPTDTLTMKTLITENNRLKEQVRDLQAQLSHLRQTISALNRIQYSLDTLTPETDIMTLIHTILSAALETLPANDGSLLLWDPEAQELVFVEVIGRGRDLLLGRRLPVSEGIAGWTLRERKPARVAEAAYDSRWSPRVDESIGFETGAVMSVPLLDGERPLGVLEVVNPRAGATFEPEDLDILLLVARLTELVLVRAESLGSSQADTLS